MSWAPPPPPPPSKKIPQETTPGIQRPAALPPGGNLAAVPGVDMRMVRQMFATPEAFVSMCQIVREDESVGFLEPTLIQKHLLAAMAENRWLMVGAKHRQAKVTTIAALMLLRDCMYLNGVKGALIAETQATAEDVFERIVYAYNHLPAGVRMPLGQNRRPGTRSLMFAHGGGIKVLTAGSKSPAVGRSIDRLVITEFGEAAWQRKAAINIFPTINKRPHARVVLESTPGLMGSYFEKLWHAALEGGSRFHPKFIEWWLDDSCRADGELEDELDEAEVTLRAKGAPDSALQFRRVALRTEFGGDARLFSSKYPSSPYDGWLGSRNPVMPSDVIESAIERARASAGTWRFVFDDLARAAPDARIDEPPGAPGKVWRIITVDPASYGSRGDPSALMSWLLDEEGLRDELAWSDREDPGRLARRVMALQERLSWSVTTMTAVGERTRTVTPLVVVESNAPACVQSLRDLGCKNLYWTDRNHPGWYATSQRLQIAEARTVRGLRERSMNIRWLPALHQLRNYDGSDRQAHGRDEGGTEHHFDIARCIVIAAHVVGERRRWLASEARGVPEIAEDAPGTEVEPDETPLTVKEWDRQSKRDKLLRRQPWVPAGTRFG